MNPDTWPLGGEMSRYKTHDLRAQPPTLSHVRKRTKREQGQEGEEEEGGKGRKGGGGKKGRSFKEGFIGRIILFRE